MERDEVSSSREDDDHFSSEDDDDGEFKGPRNKRTKKAKTCDACKSMGTRCDGKSPCQACTTRGMQCAYPDMRKRRRKKNIEPENHGTKKSEPTRVGQALPGDANAMLLPPIHSTSLSFSALFPKAAPIYQPHVLAPCLSAFYDYLSPVFPTFPQQVFTTENVVSILAEPDPPADQQQKRLIFFLQLHAILACGARINLLKPESEQYINKARGVSRELFDVTDYEVANAFILIGYYFFGNGDKNKASHYSVLAYKICENLRALESTPVGRKALVGLATITDNTEERRRLFAKLHSWSMPTPSPGELIWANIMQVHTELLFNPHADFVSLLRLLEDTTAWLPNLGNEFQQASLATIISGFRAGVLWFAGYGEMSVEWANKTSQACKTPFVWRCPAIVVMALEMAAMVHFEIRRGDSLQADLQSLKSLSEVYPIADGVIRRLSDLLRNLDHPINPVTPHAVPSMTIPPTAKIPTVHPIQSPVITPVPVSSMQATPAFGMKPSAPVMFPRLPSYAAEPPSPFLSSPAMPSSHPPPPLLPSIPPPMPTVMKPKDGLLAHHWSTDGFGPLPGDLVSPDEHLFGNQSVQFYNHHLAPSSTH
jgi:hypothetical protein